MQEKLKKLLSSKGITQRQLAKKVGMSFRVLNYKICGKRDFSYSEVERICEVLGIENPRTVFNTRKEANEDEKKDHD